MNEIQKVSLSIQFFIGDRTQCIHPDLVKEKKVFFAALQSVASFVVVLPDWRVYRNWYGKVVDEGEAQICDFPYQLSSGLGISEWVGDRALFCFTFESGVLFPVAMVETLKKACQDFLFSHSDGVSVEYYKTVQKTHKTVIDISELVPR